MYTVSLRFVCNLANRIELRRYFTVTVQTLSLTGRSGLTVYNMPDCGLFGRMIEYHRRLLYVYHGNHCGVLSMGCTHHLRPQQPRVKTAIAQQLDCVEFCR